MFKKLMLNFFSIAEKTTLYSRCSQNLIILVSLIALGQKLSITVAITFLDKENPKDKEKSYWQKKQLIFVAIIKS